jgi:uncharacterized phage-like protein YoqJ
MTTIAGTGHRPGKRFDYSEETFEDLVATASAWLKNNRPDTVISGMALGWDQALAVAAVRLGIPIHAYIPFIGQADAWPKPAVERYWRLLEQCAEKVTVCLGGYAPEKMQRRNEAMVDACDTVLALWDGSPGGTGNCVRYAEKTGKPVVNVWNLYADAL